MIIGNVSIGGIAAAVWAYVTRNLSGDPFTDPIGATVNWAHAGRSLDPDPFTGPGIGNLVWAHTPRTLTTLGSVAGAFGYVQQSLPAATYLDLRPPAGQSIFITAKIVLAGALCTIGLYNGINLNDLSVVTQSGDITASAWGEIGVGMALHNASANPVIYAYSALLLIT
jgi:hypothetical protein